jgi:hypothetical protein
MPDYREMVNSLLGLTPGGRLAYNAGQVGYTLGKPIADAIYQSGNNLLDMTRRAAQGDMNPNPSGSAMFDIFNITGLASAPSGLAANASKGTVPAFFSALGKGVESAPLNQAPANQWLGTLKNMPGIKQEEMDWLGVPEWLNAQKGPVTKQQISDYVKANQVDVQEVVKGRNWTPDEIRSGEAEPRGEERQALSLLRPAAEGHFG